MINLEKKKFLNKTEIIIFFTLFIILFIVFFPKNLINNFVKKDYANPNIKIEYLETMLKTKDDKNLKLELIKTYLKINKFNKALKLLNTLKENKNILLLKENILEKQYFSTKNNKAILKELNSTLFKLISYNDYNFIYKKATQLNLIDLKILTLKHLDNNINQLIDIYLWKKDKNALLQLLKENQNKNLSQKEYFKLLNISIYLKNKQYVKYYLSKIKSIKQNPSLVINAYIFLNNQKKAYKLIKKYSKNKKLIAQFALWTKDYKTAFQYHKYLPDTQKTTYQLALTLHKYDVMERILINQIKHKQFDKIDELKFVFLQTYHIQKGINFFNKMYKKYKLKKFLLAEFYLYDTIGDIDGIKNTAKLLGKNITPYIAMKVANIFLGEKNPQEGYKYLLLAYKNNKTNKTFNHTLYNFAIITNHKKIALEVLQKTANNYLDFIHLADYYKESNPYKAFQILDNHKQFLNNQYYFFSYINIAFKAKQYNKIISISKKQTNPEILNNPNFWYLYATSYEKLNDIKNAKQVYLKSLKYLKTNPAFYWFLVNNKDLEIKQYLDKINDKNLLLSSYILLTKYNKALIITQKLLSKNPNDLNLLVTYYDLLEKLHKNNNKLKFKIFKLSKKMFEHNKSEQIFKIYFQFGLYYQPYYKMKKLLQYAKKFDDYEKYQIMFYSYYGEYNKLKNLEKK